MDLPFKRPHVTLSLMACDFLPLAKIVFRGHPVRFVGNTIMEGDRTDRVRFALSSTDSAFEVTGSAGRWEVLQGIITCKY